MPGFFDLLSGLTGQPNPNQQLAQALQGQQGQQGPQGSMQPGGPNGQADPNNPPSPGNPPPNAAQQPLALQSTPDMAASYQQLASPQANDLMSLYLKSQRYNDASNQFMHGLAIIAANHSSPAMARAIMDSVGGSSTPPLGDLMSIYNFQQKQQAMQGMLGQADALDQKLGYPPGTSRSMILAGRGDELVQDLKPTDLQRNYDWAHLTYAANHPGASPEEIDAGAQSILLGAGGGGAAGSEIGSMNIARANWLRDPANQGKQPPGYMSDLSKWRLYQADLNDARTQFGGLNSTLDTFVDHMSKVANNPSLDKITGSAPNIMAGTVEGLLPGEVKDLQSDMSGLAKEAKDMSSRGGPKGVNQNIKTLGSDPDAFTNSSLTDYRGQVIAPRMRQALTAQANARGAAGMANSPDTPGYLQHYMDPMYKSGGELDIGGSPKKVTPDTDANGKPLPAPTEADLKIFYKNLERRGPDRALAQLKADGIDTSTLR